MDGVLGEQASAPSPIFLQSSVLDSLGQKWNSPLFLYLNLHIEEFSHVLHHSPMVLVNPLKITCQQLPQSFQLLSQSLLPIRPTTASSSFGFLVPILDGISSIYPLIALVSDNVC